MRLELDIDNATAALVLAFLRRLRVRTGERLTRTMDHRKAESETAGYVFLSRVEKLIRDRS